MNAFVCNPAEYTLYRPQYPDSLFKYLHAVAVDKKMVLECGAGSGQASYGLATYFNQVVAMDVSLELLLQAKPKKNIFYVQSHAECLPIKSNSIGLICIAQAMHWFDHGRFYSEVRRVIKSGGMIASWCYNKAVIDMKIDTIINNVHEKISTQFIHSKERQYVHEEYQTIPFPFLRVKTPAFSMNAHWNLHQWLGYMNTWPGVIEFRKKYTLDLVAGISDELLQYWSDPNDVKLITWPIYLLLGCVEK